MQDQWLLEVCSLDTVPTNYAGHICDLDIEIRSPDALVHMITSIKKLNYMALAILHMTLALFLPFRVACITNFCLQI